MRFFAFLFFFMICMGSQAQVDYRHFQSPVRLCDDLQYSGAYALTSMMENCMSNPVDLSEEALIRLLPASQQYIFLKDYAELLVEKGIPAAIQMDAPAVRIPQYHVTKGAWQHWTTSAAKDPKVVQQLLDRGQKGVAVLYQVDEAQWQKAVGPKRAQIRMEDAVQVWTGKKWVGWKKAQANFPDLDAKLRAGDFKLRDKNTDSSAIRFHAVSVVGYNETGFWVKGCRGTEWGDAGYALIPYAYHRWACKEVLAVFLAEPASSSAPPPNHLWKLQLRSLPETMGGEAYLQLFVVNTGLLPNSPITQLEYRVVPEGGAFADATPYKSLISAISEASGFPVLAEIQDPKAAYDVQVRYRSADGQVGEIAFKGVRWVNGQYARSGEGKSEN